MNDQELHNQVEANDLLEELSDEALDRECTHALASAFSGGQCASV